ncbi:MAG: acyl-CoA dehydrogenase family protein [Alphaproteobacteria bacterium]|jgi:alkylation response protein AidB-like acyl-CoA dehydrogenase
MDTATTLATLLDLVITPRPGELDRETTAAILDEAGKFSSRFLVDQAAVRDREGCRLVDGRVKTPTGHREAWHAYGEAGWAGLTAPEAVGGQALSMTLASAVQESFDAADPAFGMLAINVRCATRLLQSHGDGTLRSDWLPQLSDGKWAATICISEPHAGSDVGRIRTRAEERDDGTWRLTGDKCWISYGDHDLTERIGHFVLARPRDAVEGTRGLSLFLVPNTLDNGTPNGVSTMRIEEKLGLHASPTCSLVFEDAVGYLIGPEGRGLPTLFIMIESMRLGVAVQGAAVAQAAAAVAENYAADRKQGGPPDQPPVAITEHAEVQRLLLSSRIRAEAARLIALETASAVDAGSAGDDMAKERARILLPLAKSFGADAAFANASTAIQVLGGAGYVKDWPAERMLRDCRIFSIYEGTTAIQGLDLLQRRVLGRNGPAPLERLLGHLEPDAELARLVEDTTAALAACSPALREAAAVPFMEILGIVVADGMLRRAGRQAGPLADRYGAMADFHSVEAQSRCEALADRCGRGDVSPYFSRIFR